MNVQIQSWASNPLEVQNQTFKRLIQKAQTTEFGKDHKFYEIKSYEQYQKHVPIRTYEDFRPFIDRIFEGHTSVLWPGKPKYFVATSGTTSGVKYIPLTKESVPFHFKSARNAVIAYAYKHNLLDIFDGKLLFLSGSPKLTWRSGYRIGRLSGIVNHQIPGWLRFNQIPSYEINSIPNWEEKINKIVETVKQRDLRMLSGIPPWMLMFLRTLEDSIQGKSVLDVMPNIRLLVHGGVNFRPYVKHFQQFFGPDFPMVETYPSTEGFVAFQELKDQRDLLLNLNSGVFFEFVPLSEINSENPSRFQLGEVKIGQPYVLIINSNAGLWAYNLGDTIEFTSTHPFRIRFLGRISHYISAFGEHILANEVETAIERVNSQFGVAIREFTVAPELKPSGAGLPHHQWFIEFEQVPTDLESYAKALDNQMRNINFHYEDLVKGKIIAPLVIKPVPHGSFNQYMNEIGKLGGQNKLPRLKNDREIVDKLVLEPN